MDNDFVTDCAIGPDGSIYLGGATWGPWATVHAGQSDFAAVKLDPEGNEVWRWQVSEGLDLLL